MEKEELFIYIYIAILISKSLLPQIVLLVYYGFIISMPIARLIWFKESYIFAVNLRDTGKSIAYNIIASIVSVSIIISIGLLFKNFNWVLLSTYSVSDYVKMIVIAMVQELIFRYYVEGTLTKYFSKPISIIATSIASSIVFIATPIIALSYLVMGLFIGWVFEQTKDIYGATLSHFIIYLFTMVMV